MAKELPFKSQRIYFNFGTALLAIFLVCGCTTSIVALVDAAAIESMQTQTTTWISLESDYPEVDFQDVEFINSSHGWIVGILYPNITRGGIILHTKDGGESWEATLVDDTQLFMQIDVVDEQTLWVTGLGCLYFTNDSGESWDISLVGNSRLSGMSTVEFINETHGWTATMQILYKTTDGGRTWQNVSGWTFSDNPRDMHFLTENDVWAIGFNGIYHSEDGGETWKQVLDRGGWSLSFPESNVAWGVSDSLLLHMRQDQTWETLPIPGRVPSFRLRSPYCTDIQFIDDQHGWIVGTEVAVMHTPDGGRTWYQQSVPTDRGNRMIAVCFVDEQHGWGVGSDGTILRTSTGGSLDALLLSDHQDLLLIAVGTIGVITIISLSRVLRRRRKRNDIIQTSEDMKSTTEIL